MVQRCERIQGGRIGSMGKRPRIHFNVRGVYYIDDDWNNFFHPVLPVGRISHLCNIYENEIYLRCPWFYVAC